MSEKSSKKTVRQKDIARRLGVSTVTVSNALAGKPGVSDKLREQIRKIAQEEGLSGRNEKEARDTGGLSGQPEDARNHTVGILIAGRYVSVGTSFYWEMYQSTAYSLSQRGILSSLEILTQMDPASALPHAVMDRKVDGLIIIGRLDKSYMDRIMEQAGTRTVLMDCYYPEYDCSAVLSSNYVGMYRSTQYLVDHGHREIGFIGTPETSMNIAERYFGYRRCLKDNHIDYHREWLIRDRTLADEIPDIQLPRKLPTAFASSSDFAAGRMADSLQERRLHIPEDISIASYDDYLYDHPLGKILTTFHVDMDRMAQAAVNIMEQNFVRRRAPQVIYIDGHITERESVRDISHSTEGQQ